MKFFLILLILSLPGLAQEEDEILYESPPVENINIPAPSEEGAEIVQPEQPAFNPQKELKDLGYEHIDARTLTDPRVVAIVKRMFKESGLHKAPPEDVRELILEQTKGGHLHNFLKNHPKILNTFVEILRSEEALPSAVGLFTRKQDLKTYFFIWLFLIIVGFIIKRFYFKKQKKWSKFKIAMMSFFLSSTITFVSLTIFYNMFYEELSPSVKILVYHWRRRNL